MAAALYNGNKIYIRLEVRKSGHTFLYTHMPARYGTTDQAPAREYRWAVLPPTDYYTEQEHITGKGSWYMSVPLKSGWVGGGGVGRQHNDVWVVWFASDHYTVVCSVPLIVFRTIPSQVSVPNDISDTVINLFDVITCYTAIQSHVCNKSNC
jgi:hypothetical protein